MALATRPRLTATRIGRPYNAVVNLFEVQKPPTKDFYHYDAFEPPLENSRARRYIIHILQTRAAPQLSKGVFDGTQNLFAHEQFFTGSRTFEIEESQSRPGRPPRVYRVTLRFASVISPRDLAQMLQPGYSGGPLTNTTALQCINLVFRQEAALKHKVHTKHKFFIKTLQSIGGLEIWRAYYQSVRPIMSRLAINVDISSGILYQRGPIENFALSHMRSRDARDLDRLTERDAWFSSLRSILKGVKVVQRLTNRVYTIHGITCKAGLYEFTMQDRPISVKEYLRRYKNTPLQRPAWPGIITPKNEVIPFELCDIIEGQMFKKRILGELTTAMIKNSTLRPERRLEEIKQGVESLHWNSLYVEQSGMKVNPEPMRVTGRLLPTVKLEYQNKTELEAKQGVWNMRGRREKGTKLFQPVKIKFWAVANFSPNVVTDEDLKIFVRKLLDTAKDIGMEFLNLEPYFDSTNIAADITRFLELVRIRAFHMYPPGMSEKNFVEWCEGTPPQERSKPDMLLVIIPDTMVDLKKAVKQWGDMDCGVVTQCVKAGNVHSARDLYMTNLLFKINAKLGGINTIPAAALYKERLRNLCMIVGADVTHPGPNLLRPSVAALASSYGQNASQYVVNFSVQDPRLEAISEIRVMIGRALNAYKQSGGPHGKWPEQIVFFRDGVSEGELQGVVDFEVKEIEATLTEGFNRKVMPLKPKLTFVVVGKRHHIRFKPSDKGTGDDSGNCPAGFVIDHTIVNPGLYDFYLQSQAGLQGTSRPAHYIVVKDDNNFEPDELQSFIFASCHAYARATRSVSIPAPVYYAHLACKRADYHFDTNMDFAGDKSTDGGQNEFDLNMWKGHFKQLHARQQTNCGMYFI